MATSHDDMCIVRTEAPLPADQAEACVTFWRDIFGKAEYGLPEVCAGAETELNRDVVYECRVAEKLAGTAHLTTSRTAPTLGGLGEVGTHPEFRRRGIASKLCVLTRDEFAAGGGEALFLGTGNPEAARIYRRCGWLKLAGANVMALITTGESPEVFLVRRFAERSPTAVIGGTAEQRIPMIPLIVSPHPWQVMDANVDLLSTRYAVQCSCMGLYPRYAKLVAKGDAWFGARTERGCLVGLSSVCVNGNGEHQVDGFMHANFLDDWPQLMEAPLEWAAQRGASQCVARVSAEDEDKVECFLSIGFREDGAADDLDVGERRVPAVRLVGQV